MRVPSGDHWGWSSIAGLSVSLVNPLPSAFITKRSTLLNWISWLNTKRIFFPSGDQVGYWLKPELSVSRVTPLPSAFMA